MSEYKGSKRIHVTYKKDKSFDKKIITIDLSCEKVEVVKATAKALSCTDLLIRDLENLISASIELINPNVQQSALDRYSEAIRTAKNTLKTAL